MKTPYLLPNLHRTLVSLLLAAALHTPLAHAADGNPPERLTYQGYLTDANGNALGTNAPKNYDVIFRLYDSQTGGSELWAEQQTVTVDKGYFSVLLGEGSQYQSEPHPLILSGLFTNNTASDRYVEITVKGIGAGSLPADVPILPRLRLLTSPYAFLARNAVNAANAASLGNNLNNPIVTITTNNYVGINQTSPATPLDVNGTASATAFIGNGANLTGLNATNITAGTLTDARLSANVAFLSGNQTFTGQNSFLTNVTIGLSTPSMAGVKLDVGGAAKATDLYLGGNYSDGGFTALHEGVSATYGGYSYLQSVQSSGSSYGTLALNALGGNVGIGTTNPAAKLDVNGSIQLGTVTKVSAVGGDEADLKIVRGSVSGAGTIVAGSGFTVQKGTFALSSQSFKITFTRPFSGRPTITGAGSPNGSPYSDIPDGLAIIRVSSTNDWFECVPMSGTGVYWNNPFEFIAIGPR